MTLEIAQLGQPVLRQKADEIPAEEINKPEFQQLIDEMLATVAENYGAGLAGPQVFAGKRVFVALMEPPGSEGTKSYEVVINPRVAALSDEVRVDWEGCLSFEELLVLVPRYQNVRLEYVDRNNKPITRDLEDFAARVVQHEYDHLDGILTIDRAPSTRYIIKGSEVDAATKDLQEQAKQS